MTDQVIIQVLLLIGVAVVAVLLTRSTATARHQAIRRLMLVGFVVGAVTSVIFPSWLTWLARLVGVGRGTDLLLYGLVIAFLSYIATTFRRINELERKITTLTREVALARAKYEGDEPSVGPAAAGDAAHGGTAHDGAAQAGPAHDGAAQAGPAHDGAAQAGPAQAGPAQAGAALGTADATGVKGRAEADPVARSGYAERDRTGGR